MTLVITVVRTLFRRQITRLSLFSYTKGRISRSGFVVHFQLIQHFETENCN